ncbi:hypothetical protein LWI28_024403 [Acer negundo]|uniref:Uncharacterized protein n=1 Tax=Acer negundo TaxID=4023 RepID=A0AAD5NFD1_ACENE|nr:hypothetical protein LWI28_024403 [Acer negundo]
MRSFKAFNKVSWNLEEEIVNVIETGEAMGFDLIDKVMETNEVIARISNFFHPKQFIKGDLGMVKKKKIPEQISSNKKKNKIQEQISSNNNNNNNNNKIGVTFTPAW